jgi:hypothetical protein
VSFTISELRNNTVWQLYRMRDRIQFDPEYQRLGGIWTPGTRELLIDTILNGFDVPKLYLHKFVSPLTVKGKTYEYAIVDGKQRLETMWGFIEGKLALADDFKLFRDAGVKAAGMNYSDLGKQYPELKADFDAFALAVMLIETDDIETIEEMFSRLNEAAPLTAPEKRNAFGGPMPRAVQKLSQEHFFTTCVPFKNKRYRHLDLATKFLLIEHEGQVVDTKKARLDAFVREFSEKSRTKMPAFLKPAQENLERMSQAFVKGDALLRQVGMVMVYYIVFRVARAKGWADLITRKKLIDFDKQRANNRAAAEAGGKKVDYSLIEFDNYTQSPNDAGALKFRASTLIEYILAKKPKANDL